MARLSYAKPKLQVAEYRTALPPKKEADSHYQTPEHIAWAKVVKRRAGYRCEVIENGRRCERSAARGDRMHADHIQEIKDRPDLALDPNNGRCACTPHNTAKGIRARAERSKS